MSVCIQYSRPASGKSDSEIFGFDVAVTNFITAYFRHSRQDQFICRPTDLPSFEHFKELARSVGIDETRCVGLDPRHPDKNLQSISCLFRPDPLTIEPIWQRQQVQGTGYATCGLVHTMSGERIARAAWDLCLAPSDNTDALICPSVSIRDAVQELWNIHADYLNQRFGGKFKSLIQTPVIPLGINTDAFAKRAMPQKREAQRQTLGVTEDEIVILFVGRLSFATKAHPLPMFLAAEKAAKQTGKKVRLVLYGYFKPLDMEPQFRTLAADTAKTVKIDFVMNNDDRFPDGLWAAADIFTSLSDNVQESFGLTPIEAMACGLPAVISDWDGYREGVRNGIDGFLVPVTTPPPNTGLAIAQMYYNENNYGVALSGAGQSTAVDIDWCAQCYAVLISDADLRHKFGDSARIRARESFDWSRIILAYDDLWRDLSEKRRASHERAELPSEWQAVHPAYPNPWQMFGSFPTTHLRDGDILRCVMSHDETRKTLDHFMNFFVPGLLLPKEQILQLASAIRSVEEVRIHDILSPYPIDQHAVLWRVFGWMLKHGVCAFRRVA